MLASSQEGIDWIISDYIETHPGDVADTSDLINYVISRLPSLTSHPADGTHEERALITPPPELNRREAIPAPQNGNDCSAQASRSATEAIRQASQQASESIRQANQSASQGIQQANQSASQGIQQANQSANNAIRQVENSASQTVAQFSRSSSSISSSASSAVSSIQSSADQAVSRASNSARTALANASQAILQASAAVAAATGSAAAAGSSFLEQAAKATQSPGSSLTNEKATTNREVQASQTVAITATQAAIAIIGSIIASTLITFLIYFLFQRHRKKVQKARDQDNSWDFGGGMVERKLSGSTASSTIRISAPSHLTINKETRIDIQRAVPTNTSPVSLSLFPKTPTKTSGGGSFPTPSPPVRRTDIAWNPSKPPPPPKLGSLWLAPPGTGPIKLPIDNSNELPLGGQLKSPLSSRKETHQKAWDLPLRGIPIPPPSAYEKEIALKLNSPPRVQSARSKERQRQREMLREIPAYLPSPLKRKYSEAKASVWTEDDTASETGSGKSGLLGKREVLRRDKEMAGIRRSELWTEGLSVRTPDTAGSVRVYDAVRGIVIAPRGARRERS